jgi:hypothetical protein
MFMGRTAPSDRGMAVQGESLQGISGLDLHTQQSNACKSQFQIQQGHWLLGGGPLVR